jgi:hypothetical protein
MDVTDDLRICSAARDANDADEPCFWWHILQEVGQYPLGLVPIVSGVNGKAVIADFALTVEMQSLQNWGEDAPGIDKNRPSFSEPRP